MIRVRSACKINLTLDVLALRADGYHELDSIVHTVAMWDELTITPGAEGFACNENLPADNLCTRGAARWLEAMGTQAAFSCVHIALQKNLPIGAGIGGGSGNAAAVLLALNDWQRRRAAPPLEESRLWQIAATLGADVPLFLRGGAQRMQGIGEKLTPLPPQNFWIVLLKPPVFGDTRAVFGEWDKTQTPSQRATPRLLEVWNSKNIAAVAQTLGNDLTDAARRSGQPVDDLLNLLRDAGGRGACLSGSGAACFGIFSDEQSARAAQTALQAQFEEEWFCAAAPLCKQGVEFL
jgi:4-diphosphocytidyl-2-C-methyl-D-erythritol kinase